MQKDVKFFERIANGMTTLLQTQTIQYQYNTRSLVYQYDKVKIYHYAARVSRPLSVPLLVVFATVNRPEILDLFPEQSFIRGLLDGGADVYLLDWGYPDKNDSEVSLNDYISKYLHHGVDFICEQTKQTKINLLGICQGGLLCLAYASLFPSIKNLILISTPIDFSTSDNVIANMFSKLDVDSLIKTTGNITGQWLTNFFISLRPFELIGKKYLKFIDHLEDTELVNHFLMVEKWLYDAPDQTAASFSELIKEFYQQNKLIKAEWMLNYKRVDLSQVSLPVLNIMASEDEIIPVSASECLVNYISSTDYTPKKFPSGHIGIYISDKVGKAMPSYIMKWLKKR